MEARRAAVDEGEDARVEVRQLPLRLVSMSRTRPGPVPGHGRNRGCRHSASPITLCRTKAVWSCRIDPSSRVSRSPARRRLRVGAGKGREEARGSEKVQGRPLTSAAPRPHLGHTSATPRPPLASATPRPHLGHTSATPRPHLGHTSAISRPPPGYPSRLPPCSLPA